MRDWQQKADKYQREIEERNEHATAKTYLRRGCVVRASRPSSYVIPYQSIENRDSVRQAVFSLKKRGNNGDITVKRVFWLVMCEGKLICRWEHLCMAKAHRDGRNYHYAKYLMTGGVK